MTFTNGFGFNNGFTNGGPCGCGPSGYGFCGPTGGFPISSPLGYSNGWTGNGIPSFGGQFPINAPVNSPFNGWNGWNSGNTGMFGYGNIAGFGGSPSPFTPWGYNTVNSPWNGNFQNSANRFFGGFNPVNTPWTGNASFNSFPFNYNTGNYNTGNYNAGYDSIPGFNPFAGPFQNQFTNQFDGPTAGQFGFPSFNPISGPFGYANPSQFSNFSAWNTPWNTTGATPWNALPGYTAGTFNPATFNQAFTGFPQNTFPNAWQNSGGFSPVNGFGGFSPFGYNAPIGFQNTLNTTGAAPITGSASPIFNNSFNPQSGFNQPGFNQSGGFPNSLTGFPINTFGSAFNPIPWAGFGYPIQNQFPIGGLPVSGFPINTGGFNNNWTGGFGYIPTPTGQNFPANFSPNYAPGFPFAGNTFPGNPFPGIPFPGNTGNFQNYPFNNTAPIINGAIGLNREAA